MIATVKELLKMYDAEYAMLFGSYARGEATPDSDIDLIVYGGEKFHKTNIFLFAEDFSKMTGKNADVFEISEINQDSLFYKNVLNEGVKIAWKLVEGLRHRPVHDYDGINWNIIVEVLFGEMNEFVLKIKDIKHFNTPN